MRFSIILLSAVLILAACEHKGVNEFASKETVAVSSGAYAMSTPVSSSLAGAPSNPCAAGYDDVMTHLEKLMAKNSPQQPQ